ncbi:MAG: hypothetical protein WCQ72_00525 [Eubacteriales bacterium]
MKKLLIFAFSVMLIVSAMTVAAFAADAVNAPGGGVSSPEDFVAALGGDSAAYADGDTIVLLRDVVLGGTVRINAGEYTISGRGCYIFRDMAEGMFAVEKDAALILGGSGGSDGDPSLTLDGCGIDGAAAILSLGGGQIDMYPGTLITDAKNPLTPGISTSGGGGAVCVMSGTFNMYGGVIDGCSAANGGAVSISGGEFTQTGGSMTGCTAAYGGAVFVGEGGAFTAGGITLSGNSATVGGGICSWGASVFANCEVSYNTAKSQGGGIAVLGGSLDMAGGYIVYCGAGENEIKSSDITSDAMTVTGGSGGGIYSTAETSLYSVQLMYCDAARGSAVCADGGDFTLSDTTASYNRAEQMAAVYAAGGTLTMTGGSISSNEAALYCGGVYNGGEFTVDGGSISSNKCKDGADFALGVLNCGAMTITNGAFISFNNDVGMLDGASFTVSGTLTANSPVATLTPLIGAAGELPYARSYVKGTALVSGELSQLGKLAVSDYDGRAYTFDENGALKNNGRSADAPFPYLTVVMVCVIAAAAAALVVIFVRGTGTGTGTRGFFGKKPGKKL